MPTHARTPRQLIFCLPCAVWSEQFRGKTWNMNAPMPLVNQVNQLAFMKCTFLLFSKLVLLLYPRKQFDGYHHKYQFFKRFRMTYASCQSDFRHQITSLVSAASLYMAHKGTFSDVTLGFGSSVA